ncbi:hypothetical protein ACWF99_23520 [Nocardia sp. NPDC055002]
MTELHAHEEMLEYDGRRVDVTKCDEFHHQCIHDWRITWGNVDRNPG